MSYRNDDYKEFGGRSSRRRTDDRSRYNDIDDHRNLERGSPKQVIPLGSYIYTCQDEIICKVETDDVPFFNAPIYLENKEQIGTIVKILGNPKDYSVTIRLSDNVDVSSFKKNQKLFIDPDKLLTSQRFLPRPHRSPHMRRRYERRREYSRRLSRDRDDHNGRVYGGSGRRYGRRSSRKVKYFESDGYGQSGGRHY